MPTGNETLFHWRFVLSHDDVQDESDAVFESGTMTRGQIETLQV